MDMSIWNEIEKLNKSNDLGTTFRLELVDGEPKVTVREGVSIMVESPRGNKETGDVDNIPAEVMSTSFHDCQFLSARDWEGHLGDLLVELREFGGWVLFESQPVSWDRDEDEDPALIEAEPTVFEGWVLLVREHVGAHVVRPTLFGTWWCDTCNSPYCDLA